MHILEQGSTIPAPVGILKMPGVTGVAIKASYKRPIKRMTEGDIRVGVQAPPPATGAAAAPAADDADADPPAAAPAAEEAPAEKEASPVKETTARGGKGGTGK